MAQFVKGDIVVVPFPFSEASGAKNRPALVLGTWAYADRTNCLVCLITSQQAADPYIIPLETTDVDGGSLNLKS